MAEYVIFVRQYLQTYIARANGKQGSCTAGPEGAARCVARKLFGDRPFTLKAFKFNKYAYSATEEGKP